MTNYISNGEKKIIYDALLQYDLKHSLNLFKNLYRSPISV